MDARALVAVAALVLLAACEGDGVHETPPAGTDSGSPQEGGAGGDGAPAPDCVADPRSHVEIINACTDSQKFDKSPNLPLLLADGGLPPLP
jgi:hypothetical protein